MKNSDVKEKLIQFISNHTIHGGAYWYPLNVLKENIPIVAYQLDSIYEDHRIDCVEETLKICGITSAQAVQMGRSELPEQNNMLELLYEKDRDGYNFPWYIETFYFDTSQKWMIYVSHEGTITFSGETIAETAKRMIPERYLC